MQVEVFSSLDTSGSVVAVSDILGTNGLTVDYPRFSNDRDPLVRPLLPTDMA
ncbi:unnamed protein product, partial [marine sediment metagenome]